MLNFELVLKNILTLVVCMVIGFICQKKKVINEQINSGLSTLMISVALPCTVVVSMQKPFQMEVLYESLMVLFFSFGMFFFGTLMSCIFCKLLNIHMKETGVYLFALTLPNIVYMGFPVIDSIYGADALFYVSISNIAFNLIAFTFGIKLITIGYGEKYKFNFKKIITNMPIIATIFGLALFLTSWRLPEFLNNAFIMVGGMTTPLSMIIVGVILAKSDLRLLFSNGKMYVFIIVKLILIPVVIFFIARLFIHNQMLLGVIVLLAAMPAGTLTAIFAEQYKGNAELASRLVCLSTILSVISIPIISLLIKVS